MADSVPDIKISAVATTLMSISVKMAMTRATPRSACCRFLAGTFMVSSLVRIKANRLAGQGDGAVLRGLRIGLRSLHDECDIYLWYIRRLRRERRRGVVIAVREKRYGFVAVHDVVNQRQQY